MGLLLALLGSRYRLVAISGQERVAGKRRRWSRQRIQVARDPWLFHLEISLVICVAVVKPE